MFNQTNNPPEVLINKDFIGVWDNVILDDFNDLVIKMLDDSTQIVPRSNTSVKDAQLDIAAFNPMISNHIMCAVRGTKLYGLRIKKKSQIINDCKENIFKKFIQTLKTFV